MSCVHQAENEQHPPFKNVVIWFLYTERTSLFSLLLFEPHTDTPSLREVNASCGRPDLDVKKCAVGCGSLTVNVPVIPLALHGPVGQELEVMSAVHAVQTSQPPVVPQQVAVLGHLRHPGPTAVEPTEGRGGSHRL